MERIKTLSAGASRRISPEPDSSVFHFGYALVELLVVLTIMAVVLALAVPMFGNGITTTELKGTARELASALRITRSRAIASGTDAVLVIDANAHSFRIEGDNRRFTIPERLQIKVTSAAWQQVDANEAAFRFLPDGSASGGRVVLSEGQRLYRVDVDWVTGQVNLSD
jgi:general secretion pathway protein H